MCSILYDVTSRFVTEHNGTRTIDLCTKYTEMARRLGDMVPIELLVIRRTSASPK